MPDLHVQPFTLGEWQTNCYVVHAADAKPGDPCWIVDAGFGPQRLIAYVKDRQLVPTVVLTHAHVDHIAGLAQVRQQFPDCPILIHAAEAEFLTDPDLNLSSFLDRPVVAPTATGQLQHGDTLPLGPFTFAVRHTPGHSPGGVCLYHQPSGLAIVGDTLFASSIGRSDFPTSDEATLHRSIREQLYTLPGETVVLPGHGPDTTIAHEMRTNPFVR